MFVRCLFCIDGETHRGSAASSSYDRGEGQTIFGAGPKLPSARSPFLNFLKHLGRNEQLQYHGQSRQNRPASATLRMNTAWAITNRPFLQRGPFLFHLLVTDLDATSSTTAMFRLALAGLPTGCQSMSQDRATRAKKVDLKIINGGRIRFNSVETSRMRKE